MLQKGYFEDGAFRADRAKRFPGICGAGAIFSDDLIHNGGWYNQLGEEIGWGDMNRNSMVAIADKLSGDDIIVVVTEAGRCGYDHPDRASFKGVHQMKYNWSYLLEHVRCVLKDGTVHRIYADWDKVTTDSGEWPIVGIHVDDILDVIK